MSIKLADSFTMRTFKGYPHIAGVVSHIEQWHPDLLQAVLGVGFTYAPIAIVIDIAIPDVSRYAIAQRANNPNPVDLAWVCQALNRFEAGWTIENEVLSSPDQSQLSDRTVLETVAAGCQAYSLV